MSATCESYKRHLGQLEVNALACKRAKHDTRATTKHGARVLTERPDGKTSSDYGIPLPSEWGPEEAPIASDLPELLLSANADYIASCATLRLLRAQRDRIRRDIAQLAECRENVHRARVPVLSADGRSVVLNIPRVTPEKIVTCPSVNWEQYGGTYSKGGQVFDTIRLY